MEEAEREESELEESELEEAESTELTGSTRSGHESIDSPQGMKMGVCSRGRSVDVDFVTGTGESATKCDAGAGAPRIVAASTPSRICDCRLLRAARRAGRCNR